MGPRAKTVTPHVWLHTWRTLGSNFISCGSSGNGAFALKERGVALNQVLFGPPGTGKTYATIDLALEILDPETLREHQKNRAVLKRRFDELVQQDRVRFVTFHQSFSYEDFVEGLRATTDESTQQLRYEVVDGVFKSMCEAAAAKVTHQAQAPSDLKGRRVWKMSLGNTLGDDSHVYDECLQGEYVLLGYGEDIDFTGCTSRQEVQQRFASAGIIPANPTNDYRITSVTAFVTRMKMGDLIVVSDGNFKFRAIAEITGDYQFKPHAEFDTGYSQMRSVKWLREYSPSLPHTELLNGQFSQMTLYEMSSSTLDREKLAGLLGTASNAGEFALQVDQRFGNYVVRKVGSEQIEFDKPSGGSLPLPLSIIRQLLSYVRDGRITVEDIRQKRVFERVAESDLEKYLVNGYQNLFAAVVERLLEPTDGPRVNDARVLIIDEINRGNMSRIFGELITLIEPSKRASADEALSVVLPYSKKSFSVPNNLFLIGTMNTVDRSLAGLDIALRRRFTFREMPPKPELLDNVLIENQLHIGQLLRVMNQRIEALLDRDHRLGHAYFMPLQNDASLSRLEEIFRNQVFPLLQEYFFEDWQRIAWVLNDHRKSPCDQFVRKLPSQVEELFGSDVGAGLEEFSWEVNEEAFQRLEAFLRILDIQIPAGLEVVKREASSGDFVLRELNSGSIEVLHQGHPQQPTHPALRELANQIGMSIQGETGHRLNTRTLGRNLLSHLQNQES